MQHNATDLEVVFEVLLAGDSSNRSGYCSSSRRHQKCYGLLNSITLPFILRSGAVVPGDCLNLTYRTNYCKRIIFFVFYGSLLLDASIRILADRLDLAMIQKNLIVQI